MKLVTIAHLVRARGNKGELAAVPLSNHPDRVKNVLVNGVPMELENTWMHGDHIIFKFKGIDSISDAERLAGADVSIPMEQRAEIEPGEYYQSDLVGCTVFHVAGTVLGVVEDFQDYGSAPLLIVKTPADKELLIPFAKSICTKVDTEQHRIEVNPPDGLLDLN